MKKKCCEFEHSLEKYTDHKKTSPINVKSIWFSLQLAITFYAYYIKTFIEYVLRCLPFGRNIHFIKIQSQPKKSHKHSFFFSFFHFFSLNLSCSVTWIDCNTDCVVHLWFSIVGSVGNLLLKAPCKNGTWTRSSSKLWFTGSRRQLGQI